MKFLTPFLVVSLILSSSLAAAESTPPAAVTLNPDTLRHHLLETNLSIYEALQRVHDAKDQVNIARGNLLPSIGLGGLLNMASGPSFVLSSITFLCPFLLPSNWFNFYQEKNLFRAEVLSYRILELNAYSSALSTYFTILADRANQQIYEEQAGDIGHIYEIMKQESDLLGTISPEDLAQAKAQADMARIRASQMAELGHQELAAIRGSLGLPLSTVLSLETATIPASDAEKASNVQAVVDQAVSTAPERIQIDYLVKASKAAKWSKAFAFINSASVGSSSSGGANASFSGMKGSASVNLGFAYFPTIKLSNRNTREIELQLTQLIQDNTQILEASLASVKEAQFQYDLATSAADNMRFVYETKLHKYDLGFETLTNVLNARIQMAEASVAHVQAERDLNLLRTALHRTLGTELFAKIKGCDLPEPEKEGFWKKVGHLFGRGNSHKTLDQVCTEGGVRD